MTGRPLRILVLAPQPLFEIRGIPLAVLHLTRALSGLGHRVDLLTFPQGEDARAEGVRHLRSLRLPVGRAKAGPSLAKLVLQLILKPDHRQEHDPPPAWRYFDIWMELRAELQQAAQSPPR
jgi:hypothetical protein